MSSSNTPFPTEEAPAKQTEIRCGLVLYGGVSLAVYINGVVREFFEAVRGRGTYAVLKDFLDADIVVDIVSGASAGGVNGVFLGRALATGGDFAASADLWRIKGDFGELIEDPFKETFENGKAYPPSLFKSQAFYEEALQDALATLGEPVAPDQTDRPSFVSEMDVFIAGTDYYGRTWTERDARDSTIEVKDHRALFHLKHRVDRSHKGVAVRKSAFTPTDRDSDESIQNGLARIARITSSFPAAFAPVPFDPDDKVDPRNDFLVRALSRKQGLQKTWFIDGGVLDNKPFTSTLREIYYRSTDRSVDRKVFYVEPDPERLAPAPGKTLRSEPEAESVVFSAVSTLPAYESVVGDLEAVKTHNERVRRFTELAANLREDASKAGPNEAARKIYLRARRAALREQIVCVVRETRDVEDLPRLDKWLKEEISTVMEDGPTTPGGSALDKLDARLHLRRHFHLVYLAYDLLHGDGNPGTREEADGSSSDVLRFLYAQIERLHAAHNALKDLTARWSDPLVAAADASESESSTGTAGDSVFASFVAASLRVVTLDNEMVRVMNASRSESNAVDLKGGMDPEGRDNLYEHLWSRVKAQSPPVSFPPPASTDANAQTILTQVEKETESWLLKRKSSGIAPKFWEDLLLDWNAFPAFDVHLFPLQVASGVHEQDVIDLIRISPGDARTDAGPDLSTYSRIVPPSKKLCGDAFFHFGGFFKRSWRSSDILWGRLDGADILVSSVVTTKSIGRMLVGKDPEEVRDSLKARLRLDAADAISLLQDLREARGGKSETATTRIQARFIRAIQRGICLQALPGLLEDRLVERLEWAERDPDARAAAAEAAGLRNTLQSLHENGNWAEFDRVARAELLAGPGDEGIDEVARPKLLRVGLGAGLLIERALRERLGSTKLRWATAWISRLLGFPLRTAHAALVFHERGRMIRAAATVSSGVAFIVAASLSVFAFWDNARSVGIVAGAVAALSLGFNSVLRFLARPASVKRRKPGEDLT